MEELFETQGHSIRTFKPGAIIIRTKPAYYKGKEFNSNLGVMTDIITATSRSYMSEPVEFMGIEGPNAFVKYLGPILKGEIALLNLDVFSENWIEFKTPPGVSLEDILNP